MTSIRRPKPAFSDSFQNQPAGFTPSTWEYRSASPTFSTTTTGSKINLPENHALITRKDLRQSISCFEELLVTAKAYRNALLAMSSATAAFATAMEACSRVKGCRSANSALAGASGLQYLISNHEQLLADTVYRQFEIPLLETLDHYKLVTADRLATYENSLHDQSQKIQKTEAENVKIGRGRKRDLQQFRQALTELQKQVDELDALKASYHEEVLEGEDELWEIILGRISFVIRNQFDFYEKIAEKASDPILEPMIMSIPDPFDAYGPPKAEGQILSVLSPLGIFDTKTLPSSMPKDLHGLSPTQAIPANSTAVSSPSQTAFPSKDFSLTSSKTARDTTTTEFAMGYLGGWLKHKGEETDLQMTSASEDSRSNKDLNVIEEKEESRLPAAVLRHKYDRPSYDIPDLLSKTIPGMPTWHDIVMVSRVSVSHDSVVNKCSTTPCTTEYCTLSYLKQNTKIPTQHALGRGEFSGIHFMILEYVQGETLDSLIDNMSDAELRIISEELSGHLNELHSIQPKEVLGYKPERPATVIDEDVTNFVPWLADTSKLENAFQICLQNCISKMKLPPGRLDAMGLVHGDLDLTNIIVQDGHIVAIIDWETSGFFPVWWEYAALWCRYLKRQDQWSRMKRLFGLSPSFSNVFTLWNEMDRIIEKTCD
ncbi:hypothetical protein L204_103029 [Cryptococcus depauperatus]